MRPTCWLSATRSPTLLSLLSWSPCLMRNRHCQGLKSLQVCTAGLTFLLETTSWVVRTWVCRRAWRAYCPSGKGLVQSRTLHSSWTRRHRTSSIATSTSSHRQPRRATRPPDHVPRRDEDDMGRCLNSGREPPTRSTSLPYACAHPSSLFK